MEEGFLKVKSLKEKYEKSWLGINGVTAVGIGLVYGQPGIIISVDGGLDLVRSKIPEELQSVPIRVQFTGPINPFP